VDCDQTSYVETRKSPIEAVRGVWTSVPLAAKVGKGLDRSEVLLGTLSATSAIRQAALIAKGSQAAPKTDCGCLSS
jgi:hypothetical protein